MSYERGVIIVFVRRRHCLGEASMLCGCGCGVIISVEDLENAVFLFESGVTRFK